MKEIKSKRKKYLAVVFISSVIATVFLPVNKKAYIPVFYILLTFLPFAYLNFSYMVTLSNYLLSKHSEELKELNISNSDINRIDRQFYSKRKELSKISPIVKDGLELVFFNIKFQVIIFLSVIVLTFFVIFILEFSK